MVGFSSGASGWSWEPGVRAWTSRHQSFSARLRSDRSDQEKFSSAAFVAGLLELSISNQFSINEKNELHSLTGEKIPELFFAGLLNFGRRLESRGELEGAASVYRSIVEARQAVPPLLLQTALAHLDAILGKGSAGLRAEVLVRDFAKAATDYRVILPMVAASSIYQIAKTASFGRLVLAPSANFFTRGMGARVAAAGIGFAFEVPAFLFLSRGLMELSGEKISWESGAVGRDLLGTALTLGALKMFGHLGTHVGARSATTARRMPLQGLVSQGSAFTGLYAAHRLEEKMGLRPSVDGATTLTDTLASLVSLGVGARLGSKILGTPFIQFQEELRLRGFSAECRRLAESFGTGLATAVPSGLWMPSYHFAMGSSWDRIRKFIGAAITPKDARELEELTRKVREQAPAETLPDARRPMNEVDHAWLKIIYREYPKLGEALWRTRWSQEEMRDFLETAIGDSERNLSDIFQFLPSAVEAMRKISFSYDQQSRLLAKLGGIEYHVFPLHKHLGSAVGALRKMPWSKEQKYQLLYTLPDKAKDNTDLVFAHLPSALKGLRKTGWSFDQSEELLYRLTENAGQQIGKVLEHLYLPMAVMPAMEDSAGTFQQQYRILDLLSRKAGDETVMAWRFEEATPLAFGMMSNVDWSAKDKYELFYKVMDKSEGLFDLTLNFLPGSIQALKGLGWASKHIHEVLEGVAERARHDTASIYHWLPYLAKNMRLKGWSYETQLEVTYRLAENAAELSDFAIEEFIGSLDLTKKPLRFTKN